MDKKIKILFATDTMVISGASTVVYNQLKYLDKDKFDVYLLTLYSSNKISYFDQIDFMPAENIICFDLKSRSIYDIKTWVKVIKFLKKENFSIVYTHLFITNLIVRIAAVISKVPIILTFEHSTYFNKKIWQKTVDHILSYFTDKILVTNRSVAKFTANQEKININKFFVIPNPVVMPLKDTAFLQTLRDKLNLSPNDFVIIFVGRFSEEKGIIYLLNAIAKVQLKIPRLRLLLVGFGAQESDLRKEIERLKIDSICTIVNDPTRARQYFYLGDVFVLPSLREGQSIVTYEALYAGLPVIASSLETIKEVVVDGDNGFLINPEDPDGIAEKIAYLYQNKEVREKFKINGPKSIREFTPEKNAREFEKLMFELFEYESRK